MGAVKKMLGNKYKRKFFIVFCFMFFFHSVLAVDYGSNLYGQSLYSATIAGVTATPTSGTYTTTQQVVLSTENNNTIRYSLTGALTNCSNGNLYSTPISITESSTIYTLACNNYGNFTANSFSYVISLPTQPPTNTTTPKVSGSTIQGRINNLINMGEINKAQELLKEFNSQNQTKDTLITKILTKNLKQGMIDEEVRLLQIFLNKKGYVISPSGPGAIGKETNIFGMNTKKALILFQKDNGLTPDGIVGPVSIKLINNIISTKKPKSNIETGSIKNTTSYTFTKNLKQGMIDEEVRLLQIFLNKKGYVISPSGPGAIGKETNIFGMNTKKALILFQKDNGLTPDGIVGQATKNLLNK